MSDTILKIENLSKSFGGVRALDNVNLTIKKNEIHAICGENGAGKSTLMKILDGYFKYGDYEGNFFLDGEKCMFNSPKDSIENGIAMIYQEISILKFMTIADNMYAGDFPIKRGIVNEKELFKNTEKMLEKIALNKSPRTIAGTLTTSQQQLLMIAHALVKKPKVLILDEPTSALTYSETNRLMEILKELKNEGVTCIYISHKLDELSKISDRLTVLRDGKVIKTFKRHEYEMQKIISSMVGRDIKNIYPSRKVKIGDEVLRIKNLRVKNKRIKNRYHVKDLSFSLKRGEILGIAGLVGAGRSETLNSLFGYLKKETGDIFINGEKKKISSPVMALQNGMVLLTEDRKEDGTYQSCSVKENITSSSISKITKNKFISKKKENKLVSKFIKDLRIKTQDFDGSVSQLSGGNQQKVVIAKSLLTEPEIILLDEPTRGIDVGSKYEIYCLMNDLVQKGLSIIMVSSELPELLNMCDRIIVISNGVFQAEFKKEDATEENVMKAATEIL